MSGVCFGRLPGHTGRGRAHMHPGHASAFKKKGMHLLGCYFSPNVLWEASGPYRPNTKPKASQTHNCLNRFGSSSLGLATFLGPLVGQPGRRRNQMLAKQIVIVFFGCPALFGWATCRGSILGGCRSIPVDDETKGHPAK